MLFLNIFGVVGSAAFGFRIRIHFIFSQYLLDFFNLHIAAAAYAATKNSFE
jgi:hypothetical protein